MCCSILGIRQICWWWEPLASRVLGNLQLCHCYLPTLPRKIRGKFFHNSSYMISKQRSVEGDFSNWYTCSHFLSIPDKSLDFTIYSFFCLFVFFLLSWCLGLHCWKWDSYYTRKSCLETSSKPTINIRSIANRIGVFLVNLYVTRDGVYIEHTKPTTCVKSVLDVFRSLLIDILIHFIFHCVTLEKFHT